jgi:hypothetical protein
MYGVLLESGCLGAAVFHCSQMTQILDLTVKLDETTFAA